MQASERPPLFCRGISISLSIPSLRRCSGSLSSAATSPSTAGSLTMMQLVHDEPANNAGHDELVCHLNIPALQALELVGTIWMVLQL
jgi:hypothetical protein